MSRLIEDKYFIVEMDTDASSPNPGAAIWKAQHQTVSEDFVHNNCTIPSNPEPAIIKHQLAGDRGHYSVLDHAFIKLNIGGFPHDTVMQMCRHHDSSPLVQSNRYTGNRILDVVTGGRFLEEVFYFRPIGFYSDRSGTKYQQTEERLARKKRATLLAAQEYAWAVNEGCPYEDARYLLPMNVRQHFTLSGNLKNCWHWLDQRTKADSQIEAQTLAFMAQEILDQWVPDLSAWYRENRQGKAKLAP